MKPNRIVIGVPQVRMERQEIKLDIPEFTAKTVEISFDVPSVTIRFIKDAGRRTAALAAALAQSAQDAAVKKQLEFKGRLRTEAAPLALAMFDCFRNTLVVSRSEVNGRFETQIVTLTASLTSIAAKGVPQDDDDYVAAKRKLDDAIAARDAALRELDENLAKLDASSKTMLDQFFSDSESLNLAQDMADDPAPKDWDRPVRDLIMHEAPI